MVLNYRKISPKMKNKGWLNIVKTNFKNEKALRDNRDI